MVENRVVPKTIFTLGHSTRAFEDLSVLLQQHGIRRLCDIRRFPGSRRHPHFSNPLFGQLLRESGLEYIHLEALGGRRKGAAESKNTALRNDSFRAYADYMATAEFSRAIDDLVSMPGPVAVMCAEAVPWRCHRNLLSDDLVRRGWEVVHILGSHSVKRHEMSPLAREEAGHLLYALERPQKQLF